MIGFNFYSLINQGNKGVLSSGFNDKQLVSNFDVSYMESRI